MTPTAAGLHEHYGKKQQQAYAGSFHRTVLLAVPVFIFQPSSHALEV
jgi:hypothetical protein